MFLFGCTQVQPPAPTAPEPDRVVGIELKCDLYTHQTGPFEVHVWEYSGWDTCIAAKSVPVSGVVPDGWGNLRKELTVRTAAGDHYIVSYGAEHDVWLGMEWPPK
jgi:hypothetical protein